MGDIQKYCATKQTFSAQNVEFKSCQGLPWWIGWRHRRWASSPQDCTSGCWLAVSSPFLLDRHLSVGYYCIISCYCKIPQSRRLLIELLTPCTSTIMGHFYFSLMSFLIYPLSLSVHVVDWLKNSMNRTHINDPRLVTDLITVKNTEGMLKSLNDLSTWLVLPTFQEERQRMRQIQL